MFCMVLAYHCIFSVYGFWLPNDHVTSMLAPNRSSIRVPLSLQAEFLNDAHAVEAAIKYVEDNAVKEGKRLQRWSFVPFNASAALTMGRRR